MAGPRVLPIQTYILDRWIVFERDGVPLPAQKVRLDWVVRVNESIRESGNIATSTVKAIGGAGLDVKRGDSFTINGNWYKVLTAAPSQEGAFRIADCILME